jgi:hypothetical protein
VFRLNKETARKLGITDDKPSKYRNEKTTLDGRKFDSVKEANRYAELKLKERLGVIANLRMQVPYVLIPNIRNKDGKLLEKAVIYKADFVYEENGKTVVEDVKGVRTKEYKIKRKLMLYIHKIKIKEV